MVFGGVLVFKSWKDMGWNRFDDLQVTWEAALSGDKFFISLMMMTMMMNFLLFLWFCCIVFIDVVLELVPFLQKGTNQPLVVFIFCFFDA